MNGFNCHLVHVGHALTLAVASVNNTQSQFECFPRSLGKGRYFHATDVATMLTPHVHDDEENTTSLHSKHSLVFGLNRTRKCCEISCIFKPQYLTWIFCDITTKIP